MSNDLEPYKALITYLYCDQRLDEEKILQHLEEEHEIISDILTVTSYLEQWHLIPSPSPIDSYIEHNDSAIPEDERYYPQHINCFHESDQGTQYHQSNILDHLNDGPSPIETYAQDQQSHELLALRYSSHGSTTREKSTTPRKSHRVSKTDHKARRKGRECGGSTSAAPEIREEDSVAGRERGGRRKK